VGNPKMGQTNLMFSPILPTFFSSFCSACGGPAKQNRKKGNYYEAINYSILKKKTKPRQNRFMPGCKNKNEKNVHVAVHYESGG
jgi:hypothetical protein